MKDKTLESKIEEKSAEEERLTYEDLQLPVYTNSRVIARIAETDLTVQDVVASALLARLNTFLIGTKGTGKTQLLTDVYNHYFGRNALYIEGNPEFTLSQLLQTINLEKLDLNNSEHAKTTDEVLQLTERVKFPFFAADELNRCPPIVQNYFYGLLNGYISFKGEKIPLGDSGFSVGIATGNLGDGEYVGTFKMDEALEDRFALFLNLGHYKPLPEDEARISRGDPRVKDSEKRDISEKIKKAYEEIKSQLGSLEDSSVLIAKAFVRHGLDYCKKHSKANNSKSELNAHWPTRSCEACDEQTNYCGMIKPVSPRAADAYLALTLAMQYVAKLKNPKATQHPIQDYLESMRVAGAYHGNLNELALNTDFFGNPSLMLDDIIPLIQQEVELKVGNPSSSQGEVLILAAHYSQNKPVPPELSAKFQGTKWEFLPRFLKEIYRR